MNLFELFVKIGVNDQASNNLQKISNKLGNGLKTAAKIGTAAVTTAVAGITALTTAAIKNYAEYEQLVGGVDTLFKDASKKLQKYAAEAYKTAGMSANDYMANATAFSASLISSLGGDTEKAADYANRAMVAMSDNANKMGTNIESIVQTYQSLARGNFAMLDNLKLGYGGTKAELERLIEDAASYTDIQKEMGITVDASSMSFDNIVNAITVVQGKLGIAGATAVEAGTTIEGSVNSMRAAWQNLLTGIADDNANFEGLIENFITTIVGDGTESNLGVFGNIIPRIEVALDGVAKLVEELFPKIVEKLPSLLEGVLPDLVSGATTIIETLINQIAQNGQSLSNTLISAISSLIIHAAKNTPKLIGSLLDFILALITELGHNLDEIIPELIISFTNLITEIAKRAPELTDAIFAVIDGIVGILTSPEGVAKMVLAGFELLVGLVSGIVGSIPRLIVGIVTIIDNIKNRFADTDWEQLGKDVVNGVLGGLKKAWKDLKKWFTKSWKELVSGVKDLLGIRSPSKLFAGIGKNMALGVGEGWEDAFSDIQDDIDNSLDFDETDYGITTSSTSIGDFGRNSSDYGYGSSQNVNVTVGIDNGANAMGLARALLPFLKIAEKEAYA